MQNLLSNYLNIFRLSTRYVLCGLLKSVPFCIICRYVFNIDFKWPIIIFMLNAMFKTIKSNM